MKIMKKRLLVLTNSKNFYFTNRLPFKLNFELPS